MNCSNGFIDDLRKFKPELLIDNEVDPKYLYDFCIIFVTTLSEVNESTPKTIHNLSEDGILWFAYPKETSSKYRSEVCREKGWDFVNSHGFEQVRTISMNEDWSALRFRNSQFIKRSKKK